MPSDTAIYTLRLVSRVLISVLLFSGRSDL